ncbi:MAG: NUDIX hydrolase [Thermoanaerobaculia bacterium]|nr:NUDIX hydrolase [Thermoanaerobaculia bacterium]
MKPSSASPVASEQHSAGGLVVRGDEVLLIATAGGRRWQLPKGHLEAGELPAEAAVREVREETGVTGSIVAPLSGVDYTFLERGRQRIKKHVDYFLLAYESGSEADFEPREVVAARWFPWREAIAKLSHANDRRVAEQAWNIARERQASATPTGDEG